MKDRKGFTLVEILAVIVIIGILAIIVVPSVTSYVTNTRSETYLAHEKTMEEAAQSYTVDCINGQNPCSLPGKGNSKEIRLKELIEKEYSSRLQNPQEKNSFCDEEKSYVIITNDNDEYEFESCLYCGSYASKNSKCELKETPTVKDDTPPVCGAVENESTVWARGARTISVGCSDSESGCTRDKFSDLFNETISTGKITIKNRAGKTTDCPVKVYIDNEKPTCELELVSGTYTQESNGWISGDNIQVAFKSKNDAHSGLLTYGLGTSYKTPDYNKLDNMKINSASGTTTVFGYVKDNVGNEEKCNLTLRTGIGKPDFDIYYGYQILPLKEKHTVSGMNITDNGKVTTTSATPKLTFTGMNKYTNVKRVVIVTEGTTLENAINYKLSYDSFSTSSLIDGSRIEFEITKGSYNTYEFTLGTQNNKTINIKRIELEIETGNMPTNKQVTVNLISKPTNIIKLTGFSFDDGKNFIPQYYKYFDITSGDVSGIAQTCDDVPMYSDKKNYYINKGDATSPTINISANKTTWTNTDVVLTGTGQDSGSGIIAYGFNKNTALSYNSTKWNYISNTKNSVSYTNPIQTNGTYYFNLKDEASNTNEAHLFVNWIDKLKPVCEITGNSKISCNDPKNSDYAASMISSYVFGKNASTSSSFTNVAATENLSVDTTVNEEGKWNLYAKDRAGNISNLASYDYYKVTYDKNGGESCNKSSAIVRSGQAVDLTPTCSRTGYVFAGWSLNGEVKTSLTISSNITLKATWTNRKYNITYEYNSGTAPSSGVPATYTYGTGATVNGTPTRTGYTFNGWSENSSLTDPAFSKTIGTTATGDKKFYAKWCKDCTKPSNGSCTLTATPAGTCSYATSCNAEYTISGNGTSTPTCSPNTYSITYEYNGGTAPSSGVPSSYTYGVGATINGTPTRSGYTFNGWSDNSSLTSPAFTKTIGTTATGNKKFYAKWCQNCVANPTNATCSLTASTAGTCTYTTSCKTGYSYSSGKNTRNPVCSPATYSITYEYNGGTAPSSGVPSSYTYGVGATINGTPTRSGYTFNGWSDNSSLTSPAFTKTIGTTATGNKKFYAKWCQNCVANPTNATCTLTASTAGTCSYATSCKSGYSYSSGKNTRNPVCVSDKTYAVITCNNPLYNEQSQTIATCSGGTVKNAVKTAVGTYTVTCTGDSSHYDATSKDCEILPAVATNTVGSVTTGYDTLQKAFDASTTGTVKLLKDVPENVTNASGNNKTYNSNGKTINGSLTNNGKLKVQGGGTIKNSGISVTNNSGGTLELIGGYYGISSTGTDIAINNAGTLTITYAEVRGKYGIKNYGPKVTLNESNITSSDTAYFNSNTSADTQFLGGVLIGNNYLINNNSTKPMYCYNIGFTHNGSFAIAGKVEVINLYSITGDPYYQVLYFGSDNGSSKFEFSLDGVNYSTLDLEVKINPNEYIYSARYVNLYKSTYIKKLGTFDPNKKIYTRFTHGTQSEVRQWVWGNTG